MKKILCCLLLGALLFAACQSEVRSTVLGFFSSGKQEEASAEVSPSPSPEIRLEASRSSYEQVSLYFRLGETGYLGLQPAEIDLRSDEMIASSIVSALLEGPDLRHSRLTSVFPKDTKLISVSAEEGTAIVTLSPEFLDRPDNAPADWEDSAEWQKEAAERRTLAVQSIVLALTEGGRYQKVQVLTAEDDDSVPERMDIAWFDPGNSTHAVLGLLSRDESLLLTPRGTLEACMECWQNRDWDTLFLMLCPEEGESLISLGEFETQMEQAGAVLLSCSVSSGNVSLDGGSATLTLDASIRTEYGDAEIVRESVPLTRVEDNWCIKASTLLSLMIRE